MSKNINTNTNVEKKDATAVAHETPKENLLQRVSAKIIGSVTRKTFQAPLGIDGDGFFLKSKEKSLTAGWRKWRYEWAEVETLSCADLNIIAEYQKINPALLFTESINYLR